MQDSSRERITERGTNGRKGAYACVRQEWSWNFPQEEQRLKKEKQIYDLQMRKGFFELYAKKAREQQQKRNKSH